MLILVPQQSRYSLFLPSGGLGACFYTADIPRSARLRSFNAIRSFHRDLRFHR